MVFRRLSILFALLAAGVFLSAQHVHPDPPEFPVADANLKPALLLMREQKTNEARGIIRKLLEAKPDDAELHYQMARSYLIDFYESGDQVKGRTALSLAMEELATAVRRDPNHVYALKAKSIIHARAELLFYDPNLAYELASRVARLQPEASEYLLGLADWMTGEIRFTKESGHRVPHDPMLGLDRSIVLIDRVLDAAFPHSPEQSAAYFAMAKALARKGEYKEAMPYFKQALERATTLPQKLEVHREMGAGLYRMNEFAEAARNFYQALQLYVNPVDQWLLHASMIMMGQHTPLPESFLFNWAEPQIDKSNPPLIEFTDVAPALGLNRLDGNGTCAWGDIDHDGDQDLILAGSGKFIAVYRNDGKKFTEITEEVGLARVPSGYSLNLVDYDNDGWLDLYVSLNGWSGPMKNILYRNTGGRFVNVSAESGADEPGNGFVSVWGDLDNDGDLDIVVANGVLKDGSTPQILRNNGDKTFTNVTKQAGIVEPPTYGVIGVALGDYDRDGDLDILINGLDTAPNRLYRNDGNMKFTEVTRQAGVQQAAHNGFVCFFFDYNNDGYPDILTTALAPWDVTVDALKVGFTLPSARAMHVDVPHLFRNNKNGTFTDVTFEAKLYYPMGIMGAGVADLDNDGYVDIYFGTGDPQLSRIEPNRFFRNNGDGTFTDLTRLTPFIQAGRKGHGVTFIDIDEDGDLDMYTQLGGHYPGDHAENAFYINGKGNKNNWLQVDLVGVKSNRFAVGAQVTLRSGTFLTYKEVKGSEGFGSTSPYRVHLGLGKRQTIDSIEIRWPSGHVHKLANPPVNKIIEVKEDAETWRVVR